MGTLSNQDELDAAYLRRTIRPARPRNPSGILQVVDLFCGCGGMTQGLVQAAYEFGWDVNVQLALDVEPNAVDVYNANFGGAETACVEDRFPGELGAPVSDAVAQGFAGELRPHVLLGGPPCQGNSSNNNHTRRTDDRNELYVRMARAADVLKPDVVVIENVPEVIHGKGRVVDRAKADLERQRYSVDCRVLKLTAFGVPQMRQRHVLVASRLPNLSPAMILSAAEHQGKRTVGWAIGDLVDREDAPGLDSHGRPIQRTKERIDYLFDHELYRLPDSERPDCHRLKDHSYVSVYGRMDWDQPAQTITTGFTCMGQGCYVHPKVRRTITPREAARLQTFPDFFEFGTKTRTHLAKLIGNAVPPALTAAIGRVVIPFLECGQGRSNPADSTTVSPAPSSLLPRAETAAPSGQASTSPR